MSPDRLSRLEAELDRWPERVIACSGGVDSLLLATVAHRLRPTSTTVAHAVTPAVPAAATARASAWAQAEGWSWRVVSTNEFTDERYLANPADRCYYCKDHLYSALDALVSSPTWPDWTLMSGTNQDDLAEYRPGLVAASEHGVRHPFVEAGMGKADIRALARDLSLEFAELPASPCLASRLYTGTRVTPRRLRAVEAAEELVRARTGLGVVRCRIRQSICLVEVPEDDRSSIDSRLLAEVRALVVAIEPTVDAVRLDERAYRPGRAFVVS